MSVQSKTKICFISSDPNFLGGTTTYLVNFLDYLKKMHYNTENFTWIYKGKENKRYFQEGINFIEIKVKKFPLFDEFLFNLKLAKFLKKNDFEIINSHLEGFWMNFYKKKKNQKIIQNFHGTSYYFNKCHLPRFNLIKKILISPILIFNYFMAKPPTKKADNIICVAEHVKKEIEYLYKRNKGICFVRTGVDLTKFKRHKKEDSLKKLNLNKDNFYGLYVGRGGYWRKGLDRAVQLSKEIYKLDKNYRLIVIGADKNQAREFLGKKFIVYVEVGERKVLPFYYSASDIFFCMSRYEGGAPTLVTSEAMASGCLIVCSEDSQQEIIENEKEGLIIKNFGKKEAETILKNIGNKKIINSSIKKIKGLSLNKWGEKYLEELLK